VGVKAVDAGDGTVAAAKFVGAGGGVAMGMAVVAVAIVVAAGARVVVAVTAAGAAVKAERARGQNGNARALTKGTKQRGLIGGWCFRHIGTRNANGTRR
jgi:hypothetical protein